MKDHEDGVSAYQAGKLLAAKDPLVACAREECPKIVRSDCADMLVKVANETPSVVFAASDASGGDRSDVSVTIDGKLVAERLDGRPVSLDPGEHAIKFETTDGNVSEQSLVVRQGEKNRRVVAHFKPRKESAEKEPSHDVVADKTTSTQPKSKTSAAAWIFGGLGVVALGSFTYFGLKGKSKQNDLESSCAPRCPTSDYDDMKRQYLFADISLGVAAVSLGLATYLFVHPSRVESETAKRSLRFGGAPSPHGAALSLSGTF